MDSKQIYQVIEKLVGQIEPVGDSSIDRERLENLKVFIGVFDQMHYVIDDIAYKYKDSSYHSKKVIGQLASDQLDKMGISE